MLADSLNPWLEQVLQLTSWEFSVRPEWGSRHAGSRQAIREDLARRCPEEPACLDLSITPLPMGLGLSISHHRERGGYFCSADALHLGFDMELNYRVREELVQRVSPQAGECEAAPTWAALWAAKEAAYKSLRRVGQPRGLADLEIADWQPLTQQVQECRLRSSTFLTKGVVWCGDEETWACFRCFAEEPHALATGG